MSLTVFITSSPICHAMMDPDILILLFWMLSLKSTFSLFPSRSSRGSLVLLCPSSVPPNHENHALIWWDWTELSPRMLSKAKRNHKERLWERQDVIDLLGTEMFLKSNKSQKNKAKIKKATAWGIRYVLWLLSLLLLVSWKRLKTQYKVKNWKIQTWQRKEV